MKKIQTILPYLFILFLPTQLGKHFFPRIAYISGVPIDYLLPTLYITDILAVLLIVMNLKIITAFFKHKLFPWFLVLLVINILFSISQSTAIYKSVKILEVLCLFAIFRKTKLNLKILLACFTIGSVFELSLAIAQFTTKHALQGVWYWFGERYFTLSAPNIAKASLFGNQILRPYATFSHPNSMAGFYLLVYVFVLTFPGFKKYMLVKAALLLFCTMLIFISFSKLVILTYLGVNIFFLIKKRKQIGCNLCVSSRLFVLIIVTGIFFMAQGDADSLEKRMILMDDAVSIFMSQPIVGVGLGNYLLAEAKFPSKYPYFFLQPVHNIFLLMLAEGGLLLAGYIGYVLYGWVHKYIQNETFMYPAAVIVLTGMFDHYWLTLQQNMLLLPVILGLIIHGQLSLKRIK